MSFRDLGLHAAFADRCERLGYKEPTPIQKKAIPVVLQGGDVIGCAETGTGKTAAFLLPILNREVHHQNKKGLRVLILSPTRELTTQIEAACRAFLPKGLTCAAIIGGAGYAKQIKALKDGVNILICTPGRLIDFIDQGMVNFKGLNTLVLDEADRMLDMGFLPAIKRIVSSLPAKRQTLFFSATMAGEIEQVAMSIVKDPTWIEVSKRGTAAVTVDQKVYPVAHEHKLPLLLELLAKEDFERVLVFTRTKRGADRIAHILEKRDHKSNRIHGDRSQSQREAALKGFKNGKTRVLVATDLAARGIDVDSVSHVINYDVPVVPEDYVHRIGRTGRAGNTGRAITLLTLAEEHSMRAIERLTGQQVERVLLPDFGGVQTASIGPAGNSRKPARSFRSFGGRRRR
ncbi:MAG TPA: DEAD/DEAH box helicase [Pyrinomonadaceae bacterium]